MTELLRNAVEELSRLPDEEQDRIASPILASPQRDFGSATRELERVMDEIGESARARGLTPEVLDESLRAA